MDLLHWFSDPFQYGFMQRALLEVVLMGAVTGALGAFVVVRGLAFIGDALSHAVFPGIVIAFLFGQSFFIGGMIFGLLTSFGIGTVSRNRRISEDTAIGVLFAGAFALGVTLISSQSSYTKDLASFLFGNVLGVSTTDVWVTLGLGGAVIVALVLFYKELLLNAFDPTMAAAAGYPTFALDLLLLGLITVTIIVALPAVGNILVLAMLVTPAATARLLVDRFVLLIVIGGAIGAGAGLLGLFVAYQANVAAGGTIVLTSTALFLLVLVAKQRPWRRADLPDDAPEPGILIAEQGA
ncbi:MAG: metal ABC transporter permease [Dehalococcoidia bacterium]